MALITVVVVAIVVDPVPWDAVLPALVELAVRA
jgi:hypothetical protein